MLKHIVLEWFCASLLSLPMWYAVWDDRKGDKHPNKDLQFIGIIMIIVTFCVALINEKTTFFEDQLRAAALSMGMFISLFPYIINYIYFKNGVTSDPKWWDHLSKTAVPDKWPIWYRLHWTLRMAFLLAVLIFSTLIYIHYV